MTESQNTRTREALPLVLSASDLQEMGFSRPMTYQLLNRADFPVIHIGGRKFINRDMFFKWLDNNTAGQEAQSCQE